MGTWGAGLYSNDIALDLKATISSVTNLPFEPPRLVEILCDAFPEAANDVEDEDHTTFWLVAADQLHKRGISEETVFKKALAIIDTRQDLDSPLIQEFSPSDRKKREKNLIALREKLSQPPPQKPRKTLKKPQPLIMETGDVLIYPIVEQGGCFNPYMPKATWEQLDWGAAVIVACGHVFGYLAYYTPIVVSKRLHAKTKPSFDLLKEHEGWRLERPGTCSKSHYQRMQLEKLGNVEIDPELLREKFPNMRDGVYAAVNDISISNMFYVTDGPRYREQTTIEHIADITRS